ncbi:hypothetical protein K503DRAFT_777515 [Rhizopogon vinicolor AM-OR11-026]|uniref:Uncharacterized protein n=1 Tax=Rhizopogon vinicolor AM-OR11-026 TaxID=1314800 RepID=A0A1B7MFZ0_9AGAM|nr:hypothetical protein K503DRAFT_777515 [Rhizopogon vinicolor AM-OR11-026]
MILSPNPPWSSGRLGSLLALARGIPSLGLSRSLMAQNSHGLLFPKRIPESNDYKSPLFGGKISINIGCGVS